MMMMMMMVDRLKARNVGPLYDNCQSGLGWGCCTSLNTASSDLAQCSQQPGLAPSYTSIQSRGPKCAAAVYHPDLLPTCTTACTPCLASILLCSNLKGLQSDIVQL